jgi:hypothetical protein
MHHARAASLSLAGLLTLLAVGAGAQFEVKQAEPVLRDRVLHVNSRLDLNVNPKIEEALNKGIPIDVAIEIRLVRHRWWWRNVVITDWTLVRRLQFHALSRQYLVSSQHGEQPTESFGSLAQALAYLGDLRDFTIVLTAKKELRPDARHLLVLRARLDIEALPVIMRPLAYVTPSWRLNTGWTEWPVTP